MSVTEKEVDYIANLARLRLSDEERGTFAKDLNNILTYMQLLNQVDTTDVQPLEHVNALSTVFRKDEIVDPLTHEEVLKNAPDADSDYFRVPKVIE